MIVAIAAGGQARLVARSAGAGPDHDGFIANAALGDSRVGSIEYDTLFAVGLRLTITLLINFIGFRFVRRFREAYSRTPQPEPPRSVPAGHRQADEQRREVDGLLDSAVAGDVHRDDGAAGPDRDHLDSSIAAGSAAVHRVPGLVAGQAGARPAILGSIWVIATTAVLAIPLGVAAAVQLEEFADKTKRVNHLIEVNVQNLACATSIGGSTVSWRWPC